MTLHDFYINRLRSCPSYGFKAGHEILRMVIKTAFYDSELTDSEFDNIMKEADKAHIKMMEDNYNAVWENK